MPRGKQVLLWEFERWGFDEKGWADTTRRKYATRISAADVWLEAHRNVSATWALPRDFQAYLFATPPHPRNRNDIRQALVGWGHFLVARGNREVNPALSLPRLPEPEYLPKALTREQASAIDAATGAYGPMERALVGLLLYAGLRLSEARMLEWAAVSDDGWVRFRGKRSRLRAVPLHPVAWDLLQAWRHASQEGRWVFPSPRIAGQPISETFIKVLVRQVGESIGLPGLHPHILRHTAATLLLEAGADLRTLQEFLGHADPKTTAVYTRVRPARLKEAVLRLDLRSPAKPQTA